MSLREPAVLHSVHLPAQKNNTLVVLFFCIPTWTYLELSQMDVGQFFDLVRFEMNPHSISQLVDVNNHISVHSAAEYSGYSLQYLRRVLRTGKLKGLKIG